MNYLESTTVAKRSMRVLGMVATATVLICLSIAGAAVARTGSPGATASRVVGGHAALLAEFPFIAAVFQKGQFECSGSVVAPRVILTAGHCVNDPFKNKLLPPSTFSVLTGAVDKENAEEGQRSEVERVLVAPGYTPGSLLKDAGLLILSAPVTAPPVEIAGVRDTGLESPGTPFVFAGWGMTKYNIHRKTPARLRVGHLTIQSNTRCKRVSLFAVPVKQKFCGAKTPGLRHQGACNGDSGGPAIAQHPDGATVEIGITSLSGGLRCDPEYPSMFQRMRWVGAWITEQISVAEGGAVTR